MHRLFFAADVEVVTVARALRRRVLAPTSPSAPLCSDTTKRCKKKKCEDYSKQMKKRCKKTCDVCRRRLAAQPASVRCLRLRPYIGPRTTAPRTREGTQQQGRARSARFPAGSHPQSARAAAWIAGSHSRPTIVRIDSCLRSTRGQELALDIASRDRHDGCGCSRRLRPPTP